MLPLVLRSTGKPTKRCALFAKGKAQPSLGEALDEGDACRDCHRTTDSQRDPQTPIHLPGAGIGRERDDRTRRDEGEPKAKSLVGIVPFDHGLDRGALQTSAH